MKQTLLLLAGARLLISCNERKQSSTATATATTADAPDISQQIKQLDGLVQRMDVPSQFFSAPPNKASVITGKKGTVVFIPPGDLENEAGDAPAGQIKVELKELSDQTDMVRASAPTISNGKLLVSGGAYYIRMSADGKQLRLKKGKTLKVAFPKSTGDMELFYGQRDAGKINWLPARQKLLSPQKEEVPDTPSITVYEERNYTMMAHSRVDETYRKVQAKLDSARKEMRAGRIAARSLINAQILRDDSLGKVRSRVREKLNVTLYDIAEVRQMGWLNVDKFYRGEERGDFSYTIARADSVACANIYLIFKDMNSAISNSFVSLMDSPTQFFRGVPTGKPVKLVAVGYKKDRLYASSMDITTSPDQHTHIVWHESTEAEVGKLFNVREH